MNRLLAIVPALVFLAGCAHNPPPTAGCYVESGWLDSTDGCSVRAGYPDCYKVCPDGSRVRVPKPLGAPDPQKTPPP